MNSWPSSVKKLIEQHTAAGQNKGASTSQAICDWYEVEFCRWLDFLRFDGDVVVKRDEGVYWWANANVVCDFLKLRIVELHEADISLDGLIAGYMKKSVTAVSIRRSVDDLTDMIVSCMVGALYEQAMRQTRSTRASRKIRSNP